MSLAEALQLADRLTRAFAAATKDAVTRLHAAGVPSVGVERTTGRLVWTLPDGTRTYEPPPMPAPDPR